MLLYGEHFKAIGPSRTIWQRTCSIDLWITTIKLTFAFVVYTTSEQKHIAAQISCGCSIECSVVTTHSFVWIAAVSVGALVSSPLVGLISEDTPLSAFSILSPDTSVEDPVPGVSASKILAASLFLRLPCKKIRSTSSRVRPRVSGQKK